jgi:hypothetical protein
MEKKEEHDKNLIHIIKILIKAGFQANKEKCVLGQTEVEFLGFRMQLNNIEQNDGGSHNLLSP